MTHHNMGEQVKLVFQSRGITASEFARRINKTRENIYSIFTRESIDTGLLADISKVLDYDFFKDLSKSYAELEKELISLQEQNLILKEYNDLLKK